MVVDKLYFWKRKQETKQKNSDLYHLEETNQKTMKDDNDLWFISFGNKIKVSSWSERERQDNTSLTEYIIIMLFGRDLTYQEKKTFVLFVCLYWLLFEKRSKRYILGHLIVTKWIGKKQCKKKFQFFNVFFPTKKKQKKMTIFYVSKCKNKNRKKTINFGNEFCWQKKGQYVSHLKIIVIWLLYGQRKVRF